MTKPFYLWKLVTSADNTTIMKILKSTIWITEVPFSTFDKAWQYIMGIPDPAHQKKVTEDVAHQQLLAAEKLGAKYETIIRFLKRDWKTVGMDKETIMDLVVHI